MELLEEMLNDGKSPILRVKYCESSNVQGNVTTAYAVTDVVRANMYDRIDAMSKLIGKELPEPEPVVIKGYQLTTGDIANSYIEDDRKFKSEDRFLGILLKKNDLDGLYANNGYAGRKVYEKFYLILRYPEEMKNWEKVSE